MKKFIFAIMIVLFVASSVSAIVFGGSNLGMFGYPKFSGYKPFKPYSKSSYEVDSYRTKMKLYLSEIDDYLDNAINDIERIKEAMREAKNEAEDATNEFNRFVRGY